MAKTRFCFAASVLLSATGAPVLAATFMVSSTGDAVDAAPGDGLCRIAGAASCTLRAAVQEANANTNADDIVLPAGTYRLSLTGAGELDGATGDLNVSTPIRILGHNAMDTIIDGLNADRIFAMDNSTRVAALTLNDVTLTHGFANIGGAVQAQHIFEANRSRFIDNWATQAGGAIFNVSRPPFGTDQMSLFASLIQNNRAGVDGCAFPAAVGGGASLNGAVTIVESTISDNTSCSSGGGLSMAPTRLEMHNSVIARNRVVSTGFGGGLLLSARTATAITGPHLISSTTLENNEAPAAGAAWMAETVLENSTISGNLSTSGATALETFGTMTFNQVTVAANRTSTPELPHSAWLHHDKWQSLIGGPTPSPPAPVVRNSLFADHDFANCEQVNEAGAAIPRDYDSRANLDDDGSCQFPMTPPAPSISLLPAMLMPLADNGGHGRTHALLSASPAINAGDPTTCLANDQRGVVRGSSCDMGAYEMAADWAFTPANPIPPEAFYCQYFRSPVIPNCGNLPRLSVFIHPRFFERAATCGAACGGMGEIDWPSTTANFELRILPDARLSAVELFDSNGKSRGKASLMQDNRTLQIKLGAITPGRYYVKITGPATGYKMSFPTVQ